MLARRTGWPMRPSEFKRAYIQSEARQDIAFHPPVRVTCATHLIFVLGRCGEERARLLDTMNTGHPDAIVVQVGRPG